jgi:hypothetical protein
MNATLNPPSHRFLPLLAMCCLLAGLPSSARAGILVSQLTDRATLALTSASAPGLTARIVYESQGENRHPVRDTKRNLSSAFSALALALVIPAGTAPVIPNTPSPPPPSLPPPPAPPPSLPPPPPPILSSPPPSPSPGGHVFGTPEPGSLVLALSGSGAALLAWLGCRRSNSTAVNRCATRRKLAMPEARRAVIHLRSLRTGRVAFSPALSKNKRRKPSADRRGDRRGKFL